MIMDFFPRFFQRCSFRVSRKSRLSYYKRKVHGSIQMPISIRRAQHLNHNKAIMLKQRREEL